MLLKQRYKLVEWFVVIARIIFCTRRLNRTGPKFKVGFELLLTTMPDWVSNRTHLVQ